MAKKKHRLYILGVLVQFSESMQLSFRQNLSHMHHSRLDAKHKHFPRRHNRIPKFCARRPVVTNQLQQLWVIAIFQSIGKIIGYPFLFPKRFIRGWASYQQVTLSGVIILCQLFSARQ